MPMRFTYQINLSHCSSPRTPSLALFFSQPSYRFNRFWALLCCWSSQLRNLLEESTIHSRTSNLQAQLHWLKPHGICLPPLVGRVVLDADPFHFPGTVSFINWSHRGIYSLSQLEESSWIPSHSFFLGRHIISSIGRVLVYVANGSERNNWRHVLLKRKFYSSVLIA